MGSENLYLYSCIHQGLCSLLLCRFTFFQANALPMIQIHLYPLSYMALDCYPAPFCVIGFLSSGGTILPTTMTRFVQGASLHGIGALGKHGVDGTALILGVDACAAFTMNWGVNTSFMGITSLPFFLYVYKCSVSLASCRF